MKNQKIDKVCFWKDTNKGPKILHSKLIAFIESRGFLNIKISPTVYMLARKQENILRLSTQNEVIREIRTFIFEQKRLDVYEVFVKGVGGYITAQKINLLTATQVIDDRDTEDSCRFYFSNKIYEIKKDSVKQIDYSELKNPIWKNRIINYDFNLPNDQKIGTFEKFVMKITGEIEERFIALKSIIGYLLHRNKERGEDRAIILYDENMGINPGAHGGTGKTLLSQALGLCREVVSFDGKDLKAGSWFKKQRIDLTTDILVYDDLSKNVSLEEFFAMITSGVEVEKKHQPSFMIPPERSPKIMITSNYVVKGPGGSSDERRRNEFELSNFFNAEHTPEAEFGERFFGSKWSTNEYNLFYKFMMDCVRLYLEKGLLFAPPINIGDAKLKEGTCEEFNEFAKEYIQLNEWLDKREMEAFFKEFYPKVDNVTPHIFKKWLDIYAAQINHKVETRSSGGKYSFIISG